MKKTRIFGILAILVVGLFATAGIASAYRGDQSANGPYCSEERHEAMQNAFESEDYDAWYALMTEDGRHPRVVDVVTESNFETFVQVHDAGKSGDLETASALRAELGLNNGHGPKDGTGFGKGRGNAMGQGQRMQQNNFVDVDNDGNCDNIGQKLGRGRR